VAARPAVSVITPTYCHASTLPACLRSLAAQDMPDWEQVVVDDGSTDDTWAVLQAFAARDDRIRPLRQAHRGLERLAETYNDALAACRAPWVAILEGDDLWPQGKLTRQLALHRAEPDLVLSHGRTAVYSAGRVLARYCEPPVSGRSTGLAYLRLSLLKRACIVPASVMLSRAALQEAGGFTQPSDLPTVDYPTWLRLFARHPGGAVRFVAEPLGIWRQSPSQATRGWGVPVVEAALRAALRCHAALPPELRAAVALEPAAIARAHWEAGIGPSHAAGLRGALRGRRRAEAVIHARALLRQGRPRERAEGLAGLLAAALGLHLEGAFALARALTPAAAVPPEAWSLQAWAASLESGAGGR
jgi:hypothetical protein